jgi:hypothetical protein
MLGVFVAPYVMLVFRVMWSMFTWMSVLVIANDMVFSCVVESVLREERARAPGVFRQALFRVFSPESDPCDPCAVHCHEYRSS